MPRSKHPTKKESASKRRKAKNLRKAVQSYIASPKRLYEKTVLKWTTQQQDRKFDQVFPKKLLRKGKVL